MSQSLKKTNNQGDETTDFLPVGDTQGTLRMQADFAPDFSRIGTAVNLIPSVIATAGEQKATFIAPLDGYVQTVIDVTALTQDKTYGIFVNGIQYKDSFWANGQHVYNLDLIRVSKGDTVWLRLNSGAAGSQTFTTLQYRTVPIKNNYTYLDALPYKPGSYTTGVIAKPAAATKLVVNHNLNTPLKELDVVVMIQSTSAGWQRMDSQLLLDGSTGYGFTLTAGDTNNSFGFIRWTGLYALGASGFVNDVTNIEIIVTKKQMLAQPIIVDGSIGGFDTLDWVDTGFTDVNGDHKWKKTFTGTYDIATGGVAIVIPLSVDTSVKSIRDVDGTANRNLSSVPVDIIPIPYMAISTNVAIAVYYARSTSTITMAVLDSAVRTGVPYDVTITATRNV
jgi:hypothetical protein